MDALLDVFDEIECIFGRISKDKGVLSELFKLPSLKVQAIFDQDVSAFTLSELKLLLSRAEQLLKDKQSGKVRVLAPKEPPSKTLETVTMPTFVEQTGFNWVMPIKTRENLYAETLQDRDREIKFKTQAKIVKELSTFKDIPKVEMAKFLGIDPKLIYYSVKKWPGFSSFVLNEALEIIKAKKKDKSLGEFVKAQRFEAKRRERLAERCDVLSKVFKNYNVPVSAIADTVKIPSSVIRNLLENNASEITWKQMDRLEQFARMNKSRKSFFVKEVTFFPKHGKDFQDLYKHCRELSKRLNVSENEIAEKTEIPTSLFNALRNGKFTNCTHATLNTLNKYLTENKHLITV